MSPKLHNRPQLPDQILLIQTGVPLLSDITVYHDRVRLIYKIEMFLDSEAAETSLSADTKISFTSRFVRGLVETNINQAETVKYDPQGNMSL